MLEQAKCIEVFDVKGNVIWHRRFDDQLFNRLQRLLELLPDEEALETLDKVIKNLEAPKMELVKKLSAKLISDDVMVSFLKEALTALPLKNLKEMETRIEKLKMKREPGGDCLLIDDGQKTHRLNL